jgi:small-conductance mechanosensitive channel
MRQSQPSPPNNLFHPLRIPVSFHQAPIQRSPSMNEQLQTLEHAQQTMIDLAIQFGSRPVVALLILAAGYYVGRWVGRLADSGLEKLGLDETLRQLLVRIVHILVLGLFLIMVLQNLGVQQLPLIAGLGVAGTDIALAVHGVLGILVAGLTAIHALPAAHPKIPQESEPMIRVLALADSSVQIAIHPWTPMADFCTTSDNITQAVLETFRERGITTPFPQREVRLLGTA